MKKEWLKCVVLVFIAVLFDSLYGGTYSGGTGIAADPFHISKPEDWSELCQSVQDWSACFVMDNSIDLGEIAGLMPVGNSEDHFDGQLTGFGYEITNISIEMPETDNVGLFGWVGAESNITGIKVYSGAVSGNRNVGGIAGICFGTISNCISDCTITAADDNAGGIAGKTSEGVVIYCSSSGTVTGDYYVGGLVGYCYDESIVECCKSDSEVSGNYYAGGLIGYTYFGSEIEKSFSSGRVEGSYYIGGLVGEHYSASKIRDCYSISPVTGDQFVGGLVGRSNNGHIYSSYSSGHVEATYSTVAGGLTGGKINGSINDSFCNSETCGIRDSYGGMNRTTSQMSDINTFVNYGWQFVELAKDPVWFMPVEGSPRLYAMRHIDYAGPSASVIRQSEMATTSFILNAKSDEPVSWELATGQGSPWLELLSVSSGTFENITDQATIEISITAPILPGEYDGIVIVTTDNGERHNIHIPFTVYNLVDIEEFGILAQYWGCEDCVGGSPCDAADYYDDGKIDTLDLMQYAMSWLSTEIIYGEDRITDNFESGDFSKLGWQLSGDENWTIDDEVYYEGSYSIKSGDIGHSDESVIALETDTGEYDTISFACMISSELDWDTLCFYIDGIKKMEISGENSWKSKTFTFTPGEHTFKWEYSKDSSWSAGDDCCRLDDIKIFKQSN